MTLTMIASAAIVLIFARVGALHGDTYRLFVLAEDARGVIPGSEVWLSGQKIGLVKRIDFRPVATDTLSRLLLELDVLEDYREHLRRDTYAEIRTGGKLIGAPVIHLSPGTPAFAALADDDSVPSNPQSDAENIASTIAIAARDFPGIISNIKEISGQLSQSAGRMGLGTGDRGDGSFRVLTQRAGRLTSSASSGEGTLALSLSDKELSRRARRAMARADSMRRLLASGEKSLGRLRRDSTLSRQVGAVRDEISVVRRLITESRGSAGRIINDSALVVELGRLEQELAATMNDIKRHPLRYIAF
ncbi:MAG: MlaD family protein [Gemmatimonadaceae bacterium]